MLKYLVAALLLIIAGVGGFYAFNAYIYDAKFTPLDAVGYLMGQGGVEDYKQILTTIDGEPVTLGTESTQFFGNEAKGDLNDDGIPDLAFIFTRETGGSGTFYYAVAALQNSAGRYTGTNAVFLGDRIAPQSSEIRNGNLVVNFADRGLDDPFSTPPYVGKSVYLYYDDGLKAEWPVSLYYYDPKLDTDESGNILCSEQGLVPVPRMMPGAMAEAAIRALLEGKITDGEKARGITSEFPLAGLSLVKTDLVDGVLTLTFSDPQNKTSGGSCRVSILWKQIEATAKQFPGVETVKFAPEELFQP